jgi:hypothetical protein
MESPRAPGVGVTRASETLGGDDSRSLITLAGSEFNDGRTLCAAPVSRAQLLDREADALLQQGRHVLAERLAHQAAELREAAS